MLYFVSRLRDISVRVYQSTSFDADRNVNYEKYQGYVLVSKPAIVNYSDIVVVAVIVLIGGIGGFIYFKKKRAKK